MKVSRSGPHETFYLVAEEFALRANGIILGLGWTSCGLRSVPRSKERNASQYRTIIEKLLANLRLVRMVHG
jgi:hypothetical protein